MLWCLHWIVCCLVISTRVIFRHFLLTYPISNGWQCASTSAGSIFWPLWRPSKFMKQNMKHRHHHHDEWWMVTITITSSMIFMITMVLLHGRDWHPEISTQIFKSAVTTKDHSELALPWEPIAIWGSDERTSAGATGSCIATTTNATPTTWRWYRYHDDESMRH